MNIDPKQFIVKLDTPSIQLALRQHPSVLPPVRNWTTYPIEIIEAAIHRKYGVQVYYHSFNPDTEIAYFKAEVPIPKITRWTRFKQFILGE